MAKTSPTQPAVRHRKAKFDFTGVPVYWNGGDVFTTRFLDALSINFPIGERFFMETVRAYENAVSDPKLREDITQFVRQEAQHGAAHANYNERVAKQGVNVPSILRSLTRQQHSTKRRFSAKEQLALTAAAEHVTAMLAEGLLGSAPMLDERTDPTMRALFLWHAVEEVEHKAVAFDVYQTAAGGDYFTRVRAMVMFTLYLHVRIGAIMSHMFDVDQVPNRRVMILRGLWRLYGRGGYLTRLLPTYIAWFRRDFHPWQSGMPQQVRAWIDSYEQYRDPLLAMETVYGSSEALLVGAASN